MHGAIRLERGKIEQDRSMPPSREVFLYFLMLGFINIGGRWNAKKGEL